MKTLASLALLLLVVAGCATARRVAAELFEDPSARAAQTERAPALYREGVALLEKGEAEGALRAFDRFNVEVPASAWSQLAIFNSGRALEALARWSEAGERYRSVSRTTEGKAPRLQALALYRLSFCAEGVGEDDVALAALRDVAARRSYLPPQIAEAEFPARVAGAYARLGNLEEAMAYYAQAEAGIARMRRQSAGGAGPEWLPRTLYEMGRASLRKPTWDGYEAALRPLRMGQAYLLQAAETGAAPWAERAVEDLTSAYGELLRTLAEPPSPPSSASEDAVIAKRAQQARAWDLAAETLGALDELRARQMPATVATSAEARRVAKYLDGAGAGLRQVLAQRPAGEGLTPEAAARQNKIRGRVKAPNDELERAYRPGAGKLPAKKGKPAPNAQDPNL